jgi:hypothetical protein
MTADYLRKVASKTSLWIFILQAGFLAVINIKLGNHWSFTYWLQIIAALQFMGGLLLLTTTLRQYQKTKISLEQKTANKDLPSLTVCIPARNETKDLELCLESLLRSNYPKLETIVLDDCSQNQRTPEIIRGYAQAGVRFIAGEVPPKDWLPKNYAYQELARVANGRLLLFCGVDTRFEPDTLRAIVDEMSARSVDMVSIMPINHMPHHASLESFLAQPIRYAWELSLPRGFIKRPPVLSTCWSIAANELKKAGGFEAVARSNSPESYFARRLANTNKYAFLKSSSALGLRCDKLTSEQRDTAIRTRYPQTHRRPEIVGLLSLAEGLLLLAPFALLLAAVLQEEMILALLSGLSCVMIISFYSLVTTMTYRSFMPFSLVLLPFAVVYDVAILNYSMWRYEFGEVYWKGRNVCVPALQPATTPIQSKKIH